MNDEPRNQGAGLLSFCREIVAAGLSTGHAKTWWDVARELLAQARELQVLLRQAVADRDLASMGRNDAQEHAEHLREELRSERARWNALPDHIKERPEGAPDWIYPGARCVDRGGMVFTAIGWFAERAQWLVMSGRGALYWRQVGTGIDGLVDPVIEEPEVDWDALGAWVRAVWWSKYTGGWMMSDQMPEEADSGYYGAMSACCRIPKQFALPPWEGDWRDSLIVRPEGSES